MDERKNMEKSGFKDFVTGFAAGSIIGFAAAFLFSSKTGRELKKDLESKAGPALEKTEQLRNLVLQKGNEIYQKALDGGEKLSKAVQEQINGITEKTKSPSKSLPDQSVSVMEDAKRTIAELTNEIEEKLEEIKQ